MKKLLPTLAGGLLGLLFAGFSVIYFLKLIPMPPPPPEGTPPALFMGAFAGTGYLNFIKALEILGGILVAIPRTRNLGLLVLGPIVVNILAFHIFITAGAGLFDPPVVAVVVLSAYLLWVERKAFLGLVNR